MKLIFITADPIQATCVQGAGVDRVMVDLEINGKVDRQGHLDTVISRHVMGDISTLRQKLDRSELVVRVNPLFDGSKSEVDEVIGRGADRIMLPMFRSPEEVENFLKIVGKRVPVTLLLETSTAFARLPQIVEVDGVDDVHFGLNDLHLELGLSFMFEPFTGGLLDHAAKVCKARNIPFGIGGIAPLGGGKLPAKSILAEHVRLGSSRVILSRAFREVVKQGKVQTAKAIDDLRKTETELSKRDVATQSRDHSTFSIFVNQILTELKQ